MGSFALIDCNNFYASCERVFNPALQRTPIVVLSNNDGCIVARSQEVKAMGIPMGVPYYQYRQQIERSGVRVFSSNYQLYGDMSRRVMRSIAMLVEDMEIYSIDEAFVHIRQACDAVPMARAVRNSVFTWTGIPVSIGIGATKTLAKLANHLAKKQQQTVFDLRDVAIQNALFATIPVRSIWGISGRLGRRLEAMDIHTVLQLRDSDPLSIRSHFGVVGERIVYELRGVSCLDMERVQAKKTIMSSRSFGSPVTTIEHLTEALATYAARACEKVREQDSVIGGLQIFIRTSNYSDPRKRYTNSATTGLATPTADTSVIIHQATRLLRQIYAKHYRYHKAGIILFDLMARNKQQTDMFTPGDSNKRRRLLHALDTINKDMGADTVFYLAQGTQRNWKMRNEQRSPRYSTNWQELPQAHCL